jgi:alkylation response protein AidB-like acyl-CoA dehydrogenase
MNTGVIETTANEYNEERQAFADLARDIATKKLVEQREEHDTYPFGDLFEDVIRDAGIVGFYGVNLPAEFGGVGMGTGMIAAILEKLSEADASLAAIVFTNAAALEIIHAASESADVAPLYQDMQGLGTVPVAFHAYTGPDELDIPVVNKAGASIIFGKIDLLPIGSIAKYAVVPAKEEAGGGFSYYLVDLGGPGVQKSEPVVSLGFHACPAVDIVMEKAPARLIGIRGGGKKYFRSMRDRMSVCAAAISLGIMRGSLNDALQYTADRYQGGRQIIDWGQVRMMLANMAVETKIGESCLKAACRDMECGCAGWEKTAMAAAIHVGEMATRTATDGVQLFGGNGYMRDYPQEKRMRDARQAQCLLGMAPLRKMDYIADVIEERRK